MRSMLAGWPVFVLASLLAGCDSTPKTNSLEVVAAPETNKTVESEKAEPTLAPPSPPAGPVPIPYPNLAAPDDSARTSKSTVGGQQVQLKSKSQYRQSTGDEAR